jgi:hypothetical protein
MFSSVELPGIEPATKINLTWGNAEFGWRETTPDDVKRLANTASELMTSTL